MALMCLLVISTLLSPSIQAEDLQKELRELHDRYRINRERAGIHFRDLHTGQTIYRQNIDTAYVPASNMKIITAFAALSDLGPDHTFTTELYVDQQPDRQTNLYVRGTGDPTISRRSRSNSKEIFRNWAKQLMKHGHDRIRGNLYLDSSAYERRCRHPSWSEYRHSFWYTAPVHALNFNDNCVLVRVVPRSPGERAAVEIEPSGAPVTIQNRTTTVTDPSRAHITFERLKDTWTIAVDGGIRPGTARTEWITIPYPPTYFGTMLRRVFQQQGLPIDGSTVAKEVPDSIRSTSPEVTRRTPLRQLLEPMLKESQNLYAETVFKQLSFRHSGNGSWANSSNRIRTILEDREIPLDGCRFLDGSGLSRKNRLTPRSITAVLESWVTSSTLRPYIEQLPISGRDGTMEHRLNKSPYRNEVAAKTGTLSDVRALSGVAGYRHLDNGHRRVVLFSIMVNQDLPPGNARVFIDHVARVAADLADLGK